jgi:hypothetical protein
MQKLEPIKDDAIGVYDAIVAKKRPLARRRRLQELKPRIEAAYAEYERVKPTLEHIKANAFKSERADLMRCYASSTPPLERMYAQIHKLAQSCAYCTADSATTLDHYLPQKSYPEYCTLPINLIPSCSGCNRPRDFKDRAGARALVHPYFDPIPAQDRLLVATVSVKQGLPQAAFSVDINGGTDRNFAELYARHFELLSLRERYGRAAGEALNDISRTARVWSGGLREYARVKLAEQAAAEERHWGANHFKAALVRGAATSEEFLDHCLEGNL